MSSATQLISPFGNSQLERLPRDPSHTLRAWDAADEYLLQYLHENHPDCQRPLIFNDSFGALTVSLHARQPIAVNDSYVSQQATTANLKANHCGLAQRIDSISALPCAPLAMVKLPKNMRYFAYQLGMLNYYLPAGTPILIGAMVKYCSSGFFTLFEQHLGNTSTTRAQKKARLLLGTTQKSHTKPVLAQPRISSEIDLTLFDTPNVFAAGKLDQGSRFLLQHFPDLSNAKTAIDLGCGNGILGLQALQKNPQLHLNFVDESCHAIHATKLGVEKIGASSRAQLSQNHCLQGVADKSTDAVLCNPPFHQQQTIAINIAQQMFRDSARVLNSGGTLYAIGNRHLGYHIELKKYFNKVTRLASNKKFVLWAAT